MPRSLRALPLQTSDDELRPLPEPEELALQIFRPDFLAAISDPELLTEIRGMGRELAVYVLRTATDGPCQRHLPQLLTLDRLVFSLRLHLYCVALLCRRAEHTTRAAR